MRKQLRYCQANAVDRNAVTDFGSLQNRIRMNGQDRRMLSVLDSLNPSDFLNNSREHLCSPRSLSENPLPEE